MKSHRIAAQSKHSAYVEGTGVAGLRCL